MDKDNTLSPAYTVGLGASAGGVEALQAFFDAMPPESGMAFVVIQHLAPDYKSFMTEVLSKHTSMPVCQAEDGMPARENCVYVIPPNRTVKIFHGDLQVGNLEPGSLHLPVDVFFRSLAEDQKDRAIGVSLSGTGSDGVRGIRAIKEAGGMVMVQEESSAKFSGMPGSAIATGLADYVLPVADMAAALLDYAQSPHVARLIGAKRAPEHPADGMVKLLALIRERTSLDFSAYRRSTIGRRLARRMGIARIENLSDYLLYLQRTPEEVTALSNDFLVNVTRFFRDTEAFEKIATQIIPEIFRKEAGREVRVWVPGCSTGEEAYSIAMLMAEYQRTLGQRCEIKIFATDVDNTAIEVAAAGVYPASIAADVRPHLLDRYFVKTGDSYKIAREIRSQIVFARQNLLGDPPFTKLDMISCRNLLIYLQPEFQHKALSLFNFALREGGILLLGLSESASDTPESFQVVDSKWKIYRKRPTLASGRSEMPSLPTLDSSRKPAVVSPGRLSTAESRRTRLWSSITDKLIGDFVPTCVVINERKEILHSFGKPQQFLRLPTGHASLSLIDFVPNKLALALSTAIHKVVKDHDAVTYRDVSFDDEGASRLVDVRVEPVEVPDGEAPLLLVILEEREREERQPAEAYDAGTNSLQRIVDLEGELQATQEDLRTAIEEREASNEELQASNEELLAANEELQSTNEELESLNEELHTLNAEYQEKMDELTEMSDDMDNFLRTSEIGAILLDSSLRIRKFTPIIAREVGLLPQDVGRRLTDLSHPLIIEFAAEVDRVLEEKRPVEKTVRTAKGVHFLMRCFPFSKAAAGEDQGVVATIVNVSALKESEQDLRASEERLTAVLSLLDEGICIVDEEGRLLTLNDAFCGLFGCSAQQIVGRPFTGMLPAAEREVAMRWHRELIESEVPPTDWAPLPGFGDRDIEARHSLLTDEGGRRFRFYTFRRAASPRRPTTPQNKDTT